MIREELLPAIYGDGYNRGMTRAQALELYETLEQKLDEERAKLALPKNHNNRRAIRTKIDLYDEQLTTLHTDLFPVLVTGEAPARSNLSQCRDCGVEVNARVSGFQFANLCRSCFLARSPHS